MSKKATYQLLSLFLVFVFSFTMISKFMATEKTVKKEHTQKTEKDQNISIASIEATVPLVGFNLDATLIFVFEIFEYVLEKTPSSLYEEVLFLSSYRSNIFCSTICVNAP